MASKKKQKATSKTKKIVKKPKPISTVGGGPQGGLLSGTGTGDRG